MQTHCRTLRRCYFKEQFERWEHDTDLNYNSEDLSFSGVLTIVGRTQNKTVFWLFCVYINDICLTSFTDMYRLKQ